MAQRSQAPRQHKLHTDATLHIESCIQASIEHPGLRLQACKRAGGSDVGPAGGCSSRDGRDDPEGLLLTLISQYNGAARPAVVLMMLEAQAANSKVGFPCLSCGGNSEGFMVP